MKKNTTSGDEVRSRCRDLLLNAIKGDSTPEGFEIDKYVAITALWMEE